MVNFEDAIKKPFTDIKKLIIGILLSIIPFVDETIVAGFEFESSGLGKTKTSKKMPEWKNWKYLFIKGLVGVGIKIIYMLPALIILGIGIIIAIVQIGSIVAHALTPAIITQIESGTFAFESFVQIFLENNLHQIAFALITISPILIVGGILFLIAKFVTPMAIMNYLKKKKFSAAFEIDLVFRKCFSWKYIGATCALLLLALVMGGILLFIPLIGLPILSFLIGVMGYSLFGQIYKETK
jgi:hypothetical protein